MREVSRTRTRTGRYPGRDGVTVPGWFARALAVIDDRYYVRFNRESDAYEVVLDSEQLVDEGGKVKKIVYPLIRGVFEEFDNRILEDMRRRKWIGRHFRSNAHYYAWLKEQDKIRKAKEKDNADDMITEGLIKMDRFERTKTFV